MPSLNDLLTLMEEYEQETIEFDPEKHREAFEEAKGKIDTYKELIDELESRAERSKAYAQEFLRKKEACERQAERLRKLLVFNMQVHAMPTIRGERWEVNLRRRRKVETAFPPGSQDFLQLPDLVNVEHNWVARKPSSEIANKLIASGLDSGVIEPHYEWDKEKLKEAIEKDPESVKAFASMGETVYVQFGPKKKGE